MLNSLHLSGGFVNHQEEGSPPSDSSKGYENKIRSDENKIAIWRLFSRKYQGVLAPFCSFIKVLGGATYTPERKDYQRSGFEVLLRKFLSSGGRFVDPLLQDQFINRIIITVAPNEDVPAPCIHEVGDSEVEFKTFTISPKAVDYDSLGAFPHEEVESVEAILETPLYIQMFETIKEAISECDDGELVIIHLMGAPTFPGMDLMKIQNNAMKYLITGVQVKTAENGNSTRTGKMLQVSNRCMEAFFKHTEMDIDASYDFVFLTNNVFPAFMSFPLPHKLVEALDLRYFEYESVVVQLVYDDELYALGDDAE